MHITSLVCSKLEKHTNIRGRRILKMPPQQYSRTPPSEDNDLHRDKSFLPFVLGWHGSFGCVAALALDGRRIVAPGILTESSSCGDQAYYCKWRGLLGVCFFYVGATEAK